MNDNFLSALPIGQQIRRLREARRWTLKEAARRAGTSAPTLHRYENGWDRFEVNTLRKIATALGARLDVRLVAVRRLSRRKQRPTARVLRRIVAPLFWDRDLTDRDLERHPEWVLARVLSAGNSEQVVAARAWFGDEVLRRAVERRGVDPRTRNYWRLLLGGPRRAPQGAEG